MPSVVLNLPPSFPIHTPTNPLSLASFSPPISSSPEQLSQLCRNNSGWSRRSRMRRLFVVSSSDEDSSSSATATDAAESEDAPVEVPKGPPSLISALNVEKALRGIAITEVDHYANLGLSRKCPYDQVPIAYKIKLEEVMNQELEEEEREKQLEQLKESYTILSSVEDRRLYDWSLARSNQPDRYMWPFEVDITQAPKEGTPPPGSCIKSAYRIYSGHSSASFEPRVPSHNLHVSRDRGMVDHHLMLLRPCSLSTMSREPEDVGPTRVVGYFILGWLVLGFTLSIVLNL